MEAECNFNFHAAQTSNSCSNSPSIKTACSTLTDVSDCLMADVPLNEHKSVLHAVSANSSGTVYYSSILTYKAPFPTSRFSFYSVVA